MLVHPVQRTLTLLYECSGEIASRTSIFFYYFNTNRDSLNVNLFKTVGWASFTEHIHNCALLLWKFQHACCKKKKKGSHKSKYSRFMRLQRLQDFSWNGTITLELFPFSALETATCKMFITVRWSAKSVFWWFQGCFCLVRKKKNPQTIVRPYMTLLTAFGPNPIIALPVFFLSFRLCRGILFFSRNQETALNPCGWKAGWHHISAPYFCRMEAKGPRWDLGLGLGLCTVQMEDQIKKYYRTFIASFHTLPSFSYLSMSLLINSHESHSSLK